MKTLRQDQNAKLADFEEMEKYRVGFEKTSGLIEAERERNNQDRFHFLPFRSHKLLQFFKTLGTNSRAESFKIIPGCSTQVTNSWQLAK